MSESTTEPEPIDHPRAAGARPSHLSRSTLALGGAVLVGAGFLGGYVVKDATADEASFDRPMMGGQMMGGPGGPNGAGGPMGGGPGRDGRPPNVTVGTVKSVNGTTITLTTSDGDTTKVSIGSEAQVMVTKKGTAADLAKGDQIVVHGQRDGDTIEADLVSKGRLFTGKGAGG